MAGLHGLATMGIYGCMVLVPFDRRGEPLGVNVVVDQCGVQRVVRRRDLAKCGSWRLDLCPSSTPSWCQVEWRPCARRVSDAVMDCNRPP